MRLLPLVCVALVVCRAQEADKAVDDQDYYIDDDQMYFDKNQTQPQEDKDQAYKVQKESAPTKEETNQKPPPKCLKDCKGFPQGEDAFNMHLQCEFVLGVKEGDGCANDCTDVEFAEQFATMREFCSDTADSWDGECVADCPGAPGSKQHPNAFSDDMSDNDVCEFLLPLESGNKCLEDCKDDDFTAINSIRDECAQQTEASQAEEEEQEVDQAPVEHVSAVSSAVLIGGFTMESFLEKFLERRLEDTTPDTSTESGCGSEPHWCETNLPRSETGGPHENCHSWQMDCPCTCAALPEPAADAAPEDAQQEIEQKHEQEAQEGAEESHEPPEHRGEEAFVSAMAHTLLVKRSEVDILNIISRDIQVVNQEDSSVIKTTPGIEIEFGVRFVEGAEEQQKLVAEKIRSMNLGCQYMFSGRLHCDADTQKQIERERAENAQGANRGQAPQHRRNLKESQMREQQSEDPEHKAVVNLEAQDGESTAADKQEVDLMVELRWALSTELRNSGMKVPDDFSIVAMEKPMVVLFSNGEDEEQQQQQQQQIQQQPMGYYQNPQGYGPPPAKKGLSPGATAAVVLLIFGAIAVLMIGLFMKFGKKVSKFNAQEEYGMQQRFDAAKSATSSLSPKTYDHDSPVQSRSALRAVDEDDEEVVDLEQVDSI